MGETIWNQLERCVQVLSKPFGASEIIGWFRRHHLGVNERSIGRHIHGTASNVSAASPLMFAHRRPLTTRIDLGKERAA